MPVEPSAPSAALAYAIGVFRNGPRSETNRAVVELVRLRNAGELAELDAKRWQAFIVAWTGGERDKAAAELERGSLSRLS